MGARPPGSEKGCFERTLRNRGIDFSGRVGYIGKVAFPPNSMAHPVVINGHEVIDLVSAHPNGIRLSQLSETVKNRFGASAVFHTCSRLGLDLDDLLVFMEAREKVRIVRGVVFPCSSRAAGH